MTLQQYLENKNATSAFAASQSDIGGNITFSNSGKRGSVKQFTLGLDSFIAILKDIKSNINSFNLHKDYIEKDWRDLGSEYYTDGPANAMSTVQTKPLFTTVSKIIAWANSPSLESIDTDQFMEIKNDTLQNAIDKLEELSSKYKIQPANNLGNEIPKEAKVIYSYLVKSMSHRKIQMDILGMPAPANGGGFLAMQILHDYEIRDDKKGVLATSDIDDEIAQASGKYLEALLLVKKHFKNLSKQSDQTNIDFKKYMEQFSSSTFESIKTNYSSLFNEVFKTEKDWMCPIENKLHHIRGEEDRNAVKDVIEKLKRSDYSFTEADKFSLSTFSRVIDKTINASNFINNFTVSNLQENGLTISDFFNKIKTSNSLEELKTKVALKGTLLSFIPYFFSAVKHCQDYSQFPIFYKYWYTLLYNIFGKEIDYDNLTNYYRTLPQPERHLNFCAYWGALGLAILFEIKNDVLITSKESKAYKKLLKLIPSEKYIDKVFEMSKPQTNSMEDFKYKNFYQAALEAGYFINEKLGIRFISSILTKPFVILTGLSGSGKTKLAQAFAMWICEEENQYCIVPVGADWTNREPLLGFPNALEVEKYVKPDNGVLELIIEANKNENQNKPYFLILDEMNLSHVERYFADFLSVMETKNKIALHSGDTDWNDVPPRIGFPKNLFIIGTVNIDETTYMFSPKVLDRASVIEFRVTAKEMEDYLQSKTEINLDNLKGEGKNMAESFVELAKDTSLEAADEEGLNKTLMCYFGELKKTGAEFGYRSASEIIRFAAVANKLDPDWKQDEITDAAIMQKLLPKVHGSRRKIIDPLEILAGFCFEIKEGEKISEEDKKKAVQLYISESKLHEKIEIIYPVSLEKISRMSDNAIKNGFTSYAEA